MKANANGFFCATLPKKAVKDEKCAELGMVERLLSIDWLRITPVGTEFKISINVTHVKQNRRGNYVNRSLSFDSLLILVSRLLLSKYHFHEIE
jgi:hypothetical protein